MPTNPPAQEAARHIGAGPAGWRLGRFGRTGHAVGRVVRRVTHGGRPYQELVNQCLLRALAHIDRRIDTLVARLDASDDSRSRSEASLDERFAFTQQIVEDLMRATETLRERIATTSTRIGDVHERPRIEDLLAASSARPYVAEPGFSTWDEPDVGLVIGFTQPHEGHASYEDRYKLFEDRFRGPEERVAELQRPYLPMLEGRGTVLDAGCGRGEMLDLLRAHGIAYEGVDIDEAMIARCRAKGHAGVAVADLAAYLDGAEDGQYGAIFCAQVIEHLPYAALNKFLAVAVRKLRPDGLLIAETVNPHAPHALRAFWTDLTHQHPVFPEVALALCDLAGFASAYVFHPTGAGTMDDAWTESAYAVVAMASTSG